MKKMLIVFAITILCAAAWLMNLPPRRPKSSPTPAPEENIVRAADSVREDFFLIAEDGFLNLYRRGETSALISSERLDLSLLPQGDVILLTRGIEFSDEESAFSAIEDYIG